MSRGSSELLSLVRAQVADAILAHADPDIQPDLIRLLARPGYALHPEGRCRAGLFALEVYAAVRRRYDRIALAAAAAVELQMQSGYVFDDVADGSPEPPGMDDQSPGDAGGGPSKAEELALAIALLTAGTAVAADAVTGAPDPGDALRHFCTATGGACAGQFLDARLHRRGDATLEEAHHMTRLKSGSLGAFAAGFAARLAGRGGRTRWPGSLRAPRRGGCPASARPTRRRRGGRAPALPRPAGGRAPGRRSPPRIGR